jgi:hypothetical protein
MFLDPAVEHRIFDREVALLEKHAPRLRALGVWITRIERPEIDIVYVPHLPLRLVVPVAATQSGLLVTPGQTLQGLDLPAIAARAFGARVDLRGYDQRAPSITFRDPWSWEPIPHGALPIAQLVEDPKKPQAVLLDGHPSTKQPFLCLRGVREYHEHPQHDGDDWEMYRSAINVFVLVERLARVALASVRPQILLSFGTPGQAQLQLQWAPEVER